MSTNVSENDIISAIIRRIAEKIGAKEVEVERKIKELAADREIPEITAAKVFAREHGVFLPPQYISEVGDGSIVSIAARVMEIGEIREWKKGGTRGKVRDVTIADKSSIARITFWNDLVSISDDLEVGKIYVFRGIKARKEKDGRISFVFTSASSIAECDECKEEDFPQVITETITDLSKIPPHIPVTIEAIVDTKYEFIEKEKEGRIIKLQKLLITDGLNTRLLLCWGDHADKCAEADEGDKIRVSKVIGETRQLSAGSTIEIKTTRASSVTILGPAKLKPTKVKVKELKPGMIDASLVIKVSKIEKSRTYVANGKEKYIFTFLGGDNTGWVRVVAWDAVARECAGIIREGSVVQINWPKVVPGEDIMELHLKKRTEVLVNPPGLTTELPESAPPVLHQPLSAFVPSTIREMRQKLSQMDENAKVKGLLLALVSHVFRGYFYLACPQCKKKVIEETEDAVEKEDKKYFCEFCGMHIDAPLPRARISMILDDGTGNMNLAMIGDQVVKWLGFDPVDYENPEDFEQDAEKEINSRLNYRIILCGVTLDRSGGIVNFIDEITEERLKEFSENST